VLKGGTLVYSSLISKVQKAHQYAREPERIRFERFTVTIHGDNDNHRVSYDEGKWNCTCHFFAGWGICSHTMALEQILGVMIPVKQHFSSAQEPTLTPAAVA
jgi:hypothetical protein